MANQYHNGMLSGRKIFFHNIKKSSSIDKIKRILKRLEAEIVEIYDGVNIDMVIYDEISRPFNSTDRKRKNDSPVGFQPKRQRLNACIKNILLNNKTNESIENSNNSNNNIKRSDSTLSQFLSIAKEKGSKVKTTNEVWQWLNKYYKWLIEIDEPGELIDRNTNLDSYHRVKYLNMPSLKICDPFGDGQPLILENYSIEKSIWLEFINEQQQHEISFELNYRKSVGTSRKMKKTMNDGYCENCREYYQDLCQHINTNKHNSFAENSANFREIDRFIAQTPTVFDFFLIRKSLWDKHKKSKTSLFNLPSSMKQISIHENIDNSIPQPARVPSPKQVNVESNSSSTSSSDTDSTESDSSSESSTESDSSSTESKNNIKTTNNYISSTPINKIQKPNFFSPDSISTEDQQQSQLSSHVNDVIENLDSQLLKNNSEDDDVMICSQLNRLLRSNCSKDSPVISRRFDWCKECKRNHVPVDAIDNYQCTLSPLKIENCVIELNKNMKFPVDIDETFNIDETHKKLSDNNDEAVFTKLNHKFAKKLVLSNEIIDLNSEISNIDAINSDNIRNVNTNKEVDLFSNVVHLSKTEPDNYSAKLDEIGIEKVVQKQESIDETVKTSNKETGHDCSQINERLSHVGNENKSQVMDKDSLETNTDKFNKSIQNNKIEYNSTTSDISEAEIQNKNNSKSDMIDTIDSDKEFSSSSSPTNVVFIQCSVKLERINYEDDENAQNFPTNLANEIDIHPLLKLNDEQSVMREQIDSKINICQKFQLSNQDSSDFISDQDYSGSFCGENISQSNTPTSNTKHDSIRKSRKTLELRGDLDLNSPISGKRKAAIAANRGIENANRFFDKDIRKTIKTLKETYEPFVYDPREILNKLNYSPNSSNGASKKLLKERNV